MSYVFKRISKIALFGAIILWNPIVMAPIYVLSFQIGNLIFGKAPVVAYDLSVMGQMLNVTRRYLVGNAILAASISMLSYFVVRWIVARIRKRAK